MKYIYMIFAVLIGFSGLNAMKPDHKIDICRKKWNDYYIFPTIVIGSSFAIKTVRQDRFCRAVLGLVTISHIGMFWHDVCEYEKIIQKIDFEKDKPLQINDVKNIKKPKKDDFTYSRADERDYRISEGSISIFDLIYHDND